MRVKWAPGEVCNTGGDDYLVPFNENSGSWFRSLSLKAAPKKQEAKKEEIKQEEKKERI